MSARVLCVVAGRVAWEAVMARSRVFVKGLSGSRLTVVRWLAVLLSAVLLTTLFGSLEDRRAAAAPAPPAAPAKKTPKVGELEKLRTRTSTTRRNENGSQTTALFSGPVHYRDGKGDWQRIDSRLVGDERDGYRWRNAANGFTARFKDSADESGLVSFERAGKTFRLTAEDAARSRAEVAGAEITFKRAFKDADLHYAVTSTGVKEVIELSGPDAPASYSFRLTGPSDGPAPSVRPLRNGGYAVFVAPLLEPVFVLEAPVVSEAAPEGSVSAPDRQARPVLRVEQQGRDLKLTLSLHQAWLEAPGRKFPVLLDPTMTIQPDVEDLVFAAQPGYLPAENDRLIIGSNSTYHYRSAIRFDLGDVPPDAQVTEAKLGLYFDQVCLASAVAFCGGTEHVMDAHRITTTWDVNTATQNLTFDATAAGSFTLPADPNTQWMRWPVTSVVQNWLSGAQANHGLLVKRRTEVFNSSGPAPPGRRFTGSASVQPKLEITYTSDGVELLEPETVHSNGADLRWTPYVGGSGAAFDRYEVHRAASRAFTPSADTLLTTIRDKAVTTYRDTTAAPGKAFTYKVVANSSVSNPRTVTLPASGQARKVLQPAPAEGQGTTLYYSTLETNCKNYGAELHTATGTSTAAKVRSALRFDLRDIPQNATISGATVSLWQEYNANVALSVEAHRATGSWKEGTGKTQCTGNGATWYETEGGRQWTAQGGDFDPAVAAKVDVLADADAQFHNFTVTGTVQSWVNGSAPNHGLLFKTTDETLKASNEVLYVSDDYTVEPTLRPKLTVTYEDGSVPQGPRVEVSGPGANATVNGTTVNLTAAAADDRRVESVTFLVDGVAVGTDTTAPFEVPWNSTTAANGAHQVTARATDDAGNVATSAAVSVTVDNTALPSGSLTAPASGATVSGTAVTLSADASDDRGVSQVEFLVDGVRVGTPDTTAPYSIAWNTLDPLVRIFDGAHEVTAMVTDDSGQQYVTAARSVTVNNRGTTRYKASFTLNDPATTADDVFPPVVTESSSATAPVQDPYAGTTNADGTSGGSLGRSITNAPQNDAGTVSGCPAGAYCPTVTVKNESTTSWSGTSTQLWYRWYSPNGAILFEGTAGGTLSLAAGGTTTVSPVILAPKLPLGAEQGEFRLRLDLYDATNATSFAAKGNPPVDNPVVVAKDLSDRMGLERFWQYEGDDVGAGMGTLSNAANGNMLLRWSPFFAPGRGLSTMVDLTYNSLEDHSKSPAGNNFSLSISGLTRLGEPLDIHPNKADEISGHSNKWVQFADGDGTVHRFTGTTNANGTTTWTEPAGVDLYLRSIAANPAERRWALTRPDNVTFYFDTAGFPTAVVDRNGNTLSFTLETTPPGEDPGGPAKRITGVTDAGGRTFTVDYYSKAEAKKAHVRGKIQRITDHSGSALDFSYYNDGNLLRLTQRGGTKANGEHLADRSFVFTYTTSNGTGPAITDPAARANPDPKTPNQSTRLFSVRDPRGAETTYAYYGPGEGAQLRWKLKSRTNRAGEVTTFGYDLTNRITTVTAPLSRVSKVGYDTQGKPISLTNALNQVTALEWSADFNVTKITEPSGVFSSFTYNANGYPTSQTNQAGERTELTYTNSGVDAGDAGKHLSLLATKTSPRGVATTAVLDDYQWTFAYDTAGNVDKVTDPMAAVTDYDYNLAGSAHPGTVSAVRDANGNPATTFPAYDPSGQPTEVVDPLGNRTRIGYTPDGLVRWIQDPNHAAATGTDVRAYRSYFDYDSFHRLGRQSTPKSTSTDRGKLIWSGVEFDANDNTVRGIDPHYGSFVDDPEKAPYSTASYDAMDRPTVAGNSDRSVDPNGERVSYTYDAAGRPSKTTAPKGVLSATVDDHATVYTYDALDRVIRQSSYGASTAEARTTHLCYDTAGDLKSVTSPRAGLTSVTCPATGVAFTARFDYDAAHRATSQQDPLGKAQRTTYDKNGNVKTTERDIATGRVQRTEMTYDQRDMPLKVIERFTGGATVRDLTTRIFYDKNGNRSRVVSPRGFDAAGATTTFTNYVTAYTYDAANRLSRVTLPFDGADGTERHYVHQGYDANGRLAFTSLPVTSALASEVQDTAKTKMAYFDPGWIRTSNDPANPTVHYDYTAAGWQAERVPEQKANPGVVDPSLRMIWAYFDDGQVKERRDQGGQPATHTYDANNNLIKAVDAAGITDPGEKAVETEATYTGFDEISKVRHRKQAAAAWTFSDYAYDPNGNVTVRRENGEEDTAGAQTKAPRRHELTYDGADWLTQQLNLGTDSACLNDERIVNTFWTTGWEKQRDIHRAGSGCTADPAGWDKKQTTTWDHFDNGKLKTLKTTNGAGAVTESHEVGYLDANGFYVNGNRTTDQYVLLRADGNTSATTCLAATPCDAKYTYDARERLLTHQIRAGKTDTYVMDEPTKLIGDTTIRAGNVTTQTKSGTTTTQKYESAQLKETTTGTVTSKYWYDALGNLDCVTLAAGTQANCSPSDDASASNLIADYAYDYLNRIASVRQFTSGTTRTDKADYTYDALDRTVKEVEDHTGTSKDRTTTFTYQGLTSLSTEEKQTGGTNPKTKSFSYDAYGHRIGMVDVFNNTGETWNYTYSYDVHGSVSQLITATGKVKASYGYDAYGNRDAPSSDGEALTTGDNDNQTPLSPYRYTAKRLDSGTATAPGSAATLDMGARRYGPDTTRFLQADAFSGALANLGLSLDPLTQNRYSLAGGNPISYAEADGHRPIGADDGGAAPEPTGIEKLLLGPIFGGEYKAPSSSGEDPSLAYTYPPAAPPVLYPPTTTSPPGVPPGATKGAGARVLGVLGLIFSLGGDSIQPERLEVDVKNQQKKCFGASGSLIADIHYHELDRGHATGVEACLKGRVPKADRDESGNYTPPGWESGMDRGHLMGNRFGGSNTDPRNFVPLTPRTNQSRMKRVENRIGARLNRGERIYYFVAPYYNHNDGGHPDVPDSIYYYWVSSTGESESDYIPNEP